MYASAEAQSHHAHATLQIHIHTGLLNHVLRRRIVQSERKIIPKPLWPSALRASLLSFGTVVSPNADRAASKPNSVMKLSTETELKGHRM